MAFYRTLSGKTIQWMPGIRKRYRDMELGEVFTVVTPGSGEIPYLYAKVRGSRYLHITRGKEMPWADALQDTRVWPIFEW